MKAKPTVAEIQRTLLARLEEMGFSKAEAQDVAELPGKAFEASGQEETQRSRGEEGKAKPRGAKYRARTKRRECGVHGPAP
jgi:hypothetical protein